MSTVPLGEPTQTHAVGQMVVVPTPTPPPPRTHCPNAGQPKPKWLPPDAFCCSQDHYLKATYGISCSQYWDLFERQGRRCAICRRPPRPGRRLVVDHGHRTGAVDGLAHFSCNRRLHENLRRYLADPPGRAAGLHVAPAKLKAIQAKDRAKRERERERRAIRAAERARAKPPSGIDRLRAMTKQGG